MLIADNNQKTTLVDEFFGPEFALVKVSEIDERLTGFSNCNMVFFLVNISNLVIDILEKHW